MFKEENVYTISRVGQNRIYAPYMTVYLVISLPKTPYIHRICMVLANLNNKGRCVQEHPDERPTMKGKVMCTHTLQILEIPLCMRTLL